jgi:hypothetical protein
MFFLNVFYYLEEEGEPEPEWHPYIPADPSPILTGFYSEPGKFWLSMVYKFYIIHM